MNIGIDIDDTLSNSFELEFPWAQKFDIEVLGNTGDVKNYGKIEDHNYIETMYSHWTEEQTNLFWEKYFMKAISEAMPKAYASEVIQKLQKEGNKIIIITSRFEVIKNETIVEDTSRKWLEKNNIPYDKFILNAQDKLKVAMEEKVNLFIDDSIDHCKKIQTGGIKTLLYTSVMNQGVEVPNLERVYSWLHVYEKYRKM